MLRIAMSSTSRMQPRLGADLARMTFGRACFNTALYWQDISRESTNMSVTNAANAKTTAAPAVIVTYDHLPIKIQALLREADARDTMTATDHLPIKIQALLRESDVRDTAKAQKAPEQDAQASGIWSRIGKLGLVPGLLAVGASLKGARAGVKGVAALA